MNLKKMAAATAFTLISASALAGTGDSAQSHFQAIAAGDLDKIMANYGNDAQFQWVGGPLDGTYKGTEAIRGVYAKVEQLTESANPKGSTITANVTFSGKNTIKVRYVLTYRDGKLVNEVWQIDPKLSASY
ncbi:MAG: hypothetical protein AMJ72_09020 [Acidithiobacillales bacterium SM1_46]|nr:MAG: hypothetical protein AMJ72_09020 [Acidithiobacillales bacterium SM1_46]